MRPHRLSPPPVLLLALPLIVSPRCTLSPQANISDHTSPPIIDLRRLTSSDALSEVVGKRVRIAGVWGGVGKEGLVIYDGRPLQQNPHVTVYLLYDFGTSDQFSSLVQSHHRGDAVIATGTLLSKVEADVTKEHSQPNTCFYFNITTTQIASGEPQRD